MKKVIVFWTWMMTMMLVVPAEAQVRLGLSGGVSLNKVELNGDLSQISRNYTGWYVGPTLELKVPVLPLMLDASVMYAYNGATIGEPEGEPHHVNNNYISVPLNLKLNIGVSSLAALYLSAGPQFDYGLSDKEFKLTDTTRFALKRSQLSVNVGGGIRAFDQFQIGVYYNIPCGDTAEASVVNAAKQFSFKNNMWKLNLLVFF